VSTTQVARFQSIESIDPTTVAVYPDRVELLGAQGSVTRSVPIDEIVRVKVRTLFGISSLLLKTQEGRTVVADLLRPEDAREAKAVLDELLEGVGAAA
jgi:hypothetical protein